MKKTFVLCDGSVKNSYGFRVDLSGMDLTRFRANPVMLFGHDTTLVIGKWDNVRLEGNRLLAEPDFDIEDEYSIRIQRKVKKGYLRGASIGIVINRIEEDAVSGEVVAKATELLEASIVAVPSDSGALALYDNNSVRLTGTAFKQYLSEMTNKVNFSDMEEKVKSTTSVDVVALQTELAVVKAENAELQKQIANAESEKTEAYLDAAIASGKIMKEEREFYKELAALNFDLVKRLIDKKRPAQKEVLIAQVRKSGGISTKLEARKDWNYFKWMQEDPSGLKQLKAEDPEFFAELQATI